MKKPICHLWRPLSKAGLLSNQSVRAEFKLNYQEAFSKLAVEYADALIEELKK